MIDNLFAFMQYEREWWRLQIYHEALGLEPIAFIPHERKQVVIQFLIVRCFNGTAVSSRQCSDSSSIYVVSMERCVVTSCLSRQYRYVFFIVRSFYGSIVTSHQCRVSFFSERCFYRTIVTSRQYRDFFFIVLCLYGSIVTSRQCSDSSSFYVVSIERLCYHVMSVTPIQRCLFHCTLFLWFNCDVTPTVSFLKYAVSMKLLCPQLNVAFRFHWTLFLWYDCDVTSIERFLFHRTLFLWFDCDVTQMQSFYFFVNVVSIQRLWRHDNTDIFFFIERCFYGSIVSSRLRRHIDVYS